MAGMSPLHTCCLSCKPCCTGVRYPAHLLPLVVATLTSMQSLMPALNQGKGPLTAAELSGGTALQAEALKAAAMGAGGALRTEAVSPIDKKSLTKAFRCDACLSCNDTAAITCENHSPTSTLCPLLLNPGFGSTRSSLLACLDYMC